MGLFNKLLGQQKEAEGVEWLKRRNIQILATNFSCKGGELDIIGLDSAHTLIFFEVKARKNDDHGHPSEFISPQKQQRLIKCAQVFLLKHPHYQNFAMRFDSLVFLGDAPPDWQQNIIISY